MTATATVRRSTGRKRPSPRSSRARKRRSRRRKALAFLVIVLVLALIGGSLWAMYFSTVLVTKRVNVVGTHNLAPAQVSLAAQVPLGVPLARQDLDAIAQRTTSLPAIEAASVTRKWPNAITVAVVERRPVIAVRQPEGYVLVDKSGCGIPNPARAAARGSARCGQSRGCSAAERDGYRCRCVTEEAAQHGRSDDGEQPRQHHAGSEIR